MWRCRTRTVGWVSACVLILAGISGCFAGVPKPFDPNTLSDADRGVVIDGICPADVNPPTVTSRADVARNHNDWSLKGNAHAGTTVIRWDVPDLSDLAGYVVVRLSRDLHHGIEVDKTRTFSVTDVTASGREYGEFVDSEGLVDGKEYQYRVFPVIAGELGYPSAPIEIWTPPERPPLAPGALEVDLDQRGEIRIFVWLGYHLWKQGIRVARRESGEAEWQVVHDPVPPIGYDYDTDEFNYWVDQDVEPGIEYQYAVCLTNARGAGKAVVAKLDLIEPNPVRVDPPRNIRAVQSPYAITVFWEPFEDLSVVGYEVERVKEGDDGEYEHARFKNTRNSAENFVDYPFRSIPQGEHHRFRVRTVTDEGVGPWSAELEFDSTRPGAVNADQPGPKIESLSAIHDVVYLVWSAGTLADNTLFRILRRSLDRDDVWEYYTYRGGLWVDEAGFKWDRWHGMGLHELGWTDIVGVRPDTEYEYAVQLRNGDTVGPPSEPMSIQTRPLPETSDRLPLTVYDLDAELKNGGVQLTWTLPEDPTLKGLLVREIAYDHDISHERIHRPALAPSETGYFLETSYALGGYPTCLFVQTFNDNGMQSLWRQATCPMEEAEPTNCGWTGEYVRTEYPSGNAQISFSGCEEMLTSITRHELNLDGLETKTLFQPCRPSRSESSRLIGPGEDWTCEFVDADVKPGTWYLYELRQVFPGGNESASVHEFLTWHEDAR